MEDNREQTASIHTLIQKLGHPLEEIRVRSLKNILSKLKYGIIKEEDISQDRNLLIHLLEWFNFPSSSLKDQVLQLLLKLSKHSGTSQILVKIGAIAFLVALRNDIEPTLQTFVDLILEQLFASSEDVSEQTKTTATCSYKQNLQENKKTESLFVESDKSNLHEAENLTNKPLIPSPDKMEIGSHFYRNVQYFEVNSPQTSQPISNLTGKDVFHFTNFPWLSLTETDLHVISSTNSSLQGDDLSMIVNSCNFLRDVILRDFPAEIFLQRTQIFKTLLSLITLPEQDCIVLEAVKCLHCLALSLKARIAVQWDPTMHSCKLDTETPSPTISTQESHLESNSLSSTDSRPSAIGQSELQQIESGHESNLNIATIASDVSESEHEVDEGNLLQLQLSQISVPQFCVYVLHHGILLYQVSNSKIVSHITELIYIVLDLIRVSIATQFWSSNLVLAKEIKMKLLEIFSELGTTAENHYSKYNNSSIKSEIQFHRLVYLCLASISANLLKVTLLPYQIKEIGLPSNYIEILKLLLFDKTISISCPSLHNIIVEYLKHFDEALFATYQRTLKICDSFKATCHFLLQEKENYGDEVVFAGQALLSYKYHKNIDFIEKFIRRHSEMCAEEKLSEEIEAGNTLLLKLFSHLDSVIRLTSYRICHVIVKMALGLKQVANLDLLESHKVKFLFNYKIIEEISNFGLCDDNEKVRDLAREIMNYLLAGKLLMAETVWNSFSYNLLPNLPTLQSFADSHTPLGCHISQITDTETSDLPLLEKFRGTLRKLFLVESRIRSIAVSELAWFLTREDHSPQKLPDIYEVDIKQFANLFVIENSPPTKRTHFLQENEEEGLRNVFEILQSEDMELNIKKSAVQQISFMLEDRKLHGLFRNLNGIDVINHYINKAVMKPDESYEKGYMELLPYCIKIMKFLCHYNKDLRHEVSESNIYYSLVRGAMLHKLQEVHYYDTVHLLSLLLFDEVIIDVEESAPPGGGDAKFAFSLSFPEVIVKKYHLPFVPLTHNTKSPHQIFDPTENSDDPLLTMPAISALRFTWNMYWFGSIEAIVEREKLEHFKEFSSVIHLTNFDQLMLRVTYPAYAIKEVVNDITNATSHEDVKLALNLLHLQLVSCQRFGSLKALFSLNWQEAFSRFLFIIPNSKSDLHLLYDIISFLIYILQVPNNLPVEVRNWFTTIVSHPQSAIKHLIVLKESRNDERGNQEKGSSILRSVNRQLINFVSSVAAKEPLSSVDITECCQALSGELITSIMQNLSIAEAPHFYNLATLESILWCLVHLTARRRWSEGCSEISSMSLCKQILTSLMDVISAFHAGRGNTSNSYMGKGVTKAATLCLQSVAAEMNYQSQNEVWCNYWILKQPNNQGELGLTWLVPLWTYRDPEVRAAGLGIAVNLTTSFDGYIFLADHLQQVSGGVWGAAFSFLLDPKETSFVKEQATLLLVNLTSHCGVKDDAWKGPVVQDTETQVMLVGLNAFLALLHHSNFYREMFTLISFYHPFIISQLAATSSLLTDTSPEKIDAADPEQEALNNVMQHQNTQLGMHLSHTRKDISSPIWSSASDEINSLSEEREEKILVVSPSLLSAVAKLLHNLVLLAPDVVIKAFQKEHLLESLFGSLSESQLEVYCTATNAVNAMLFLDLCNLHKFILDLISCCLQHNLTLKELVAGNEQSLGTVISLLNIRLAELQIYRKNVYFMWISVYRLLTLQFRKDGKDALNAFFICISYWPILAGNLKHILLENTPEELYLMALQCFALLCTLEIRQKFLNTAGDLNLSDALEVTDISETDQDDVSPTTFAANISHILIRKFKETLKKPRNMSFEERKIIISSFRSLLVLSDSAKYSALKDGLMGLLIDQLKELHGAFTTASFKPDKVTCSTGKRKDNLLVQDLIQYIDFIKDFMFQCENIKTCATNGELSPVLLQLWSWCLQETSAMTAMLQLLCTYSANCAASARSLAFTSSTLGLGNVKIVGSNSLVHCLIRLAQREVERFSRTRDTVHLKLVFQLLKNLCIASECRNIICKTSFIDGFIKLNPKHSKKAHHYQLLDILWLEFLVNLSFNSDGQDTISKLPGSIELLLDFLKNGTESSMKLSALILRNLCCYGPSKSRVLNSAEVVDVLVQYASSDVLAIQPIAASALWALVANSQKAKTVLKNPSILNHLQETILNLSGDGNRESHMAAEFLGIVVDLCKS